MRQELLTEEIVKESKNYPLYSQDGKRGEAVVLARYFTPYTRNYTWYMLEYDPETGDAFGYVVGPEPEYGYFNVRELQEVTIHMLGLRSSADEVQAVERDISVGPGKKTLASLLEKHGDPSPSFWNEEENVNKVDQ